MSPEPGTIAIDRLWKRFRSDARMAAGVGLRDALRRDRAPSDRWRWALRDVSLHVGPGEAVGIVGVNGSGKSTLLKILTGTMDPTAGRVAVEGRVGALIELQAGLHPELTGRENVLAYSALLGLSRRRAAAVLSPVIEFAGVGDAAGRQVKFYSTGMRLRLGFSIAVHLDAPILVVDEILAVADTDFQRACLGRIRDLHDAGTTVVVVSHDLAAVAATCRRVAWIDRGRLVADGPAGESLAAYRQAARSEPPSGSGADAGVVVGDARVLGPEGDVPRSGAPVAVELTVTCAEPVTAGLRIGIAQSEGEPLLVVERREALPAGASTLRCRLDALPLAGGSYRLWAGVDADGSGGAPWRPRTTFDVHGAGPPPSGLPLAVNAAWEVDSG